VSVINKMLRDLDARSHPEAAARKALPDSASTNLAAHAMAAKPVAARTGAFPRAGIAVLLLLVLGTVVWWWQQGANRVAGTVEASPPPAAQEQVPNATVAATSEQHASAADQVASSEQVAVGQPDKQPKPLNKLSAKPLATGKGLVPNLLQGQSQVQGARLAPIAPQSSQAVSSKALSISPRASATGTTAVAVGGAPPNALASSGSASVPSVAAASAGATEPASSANRQMQGGREALLQAQVLWNAGSHDAAVDLLQQALSLLERSGGSQGGASQTGLLASMARELGRMLVAEGRPAAALDMLSRLEPTLGREADIWALRGNAAQRLGRHQESVNAYTLALQLRPNEQRWLLASAVSLAALGQTANASDMAAKAAALGPVSKEVQAYLRQAGVRLAEP
jgi:Flp pilus assembly protein TadD